jgi:dUTP pyrophosphatase
MKGNKVMQSIKVLVKRKNPETKLPTYATEGSACFDIYPDMKEGDFFWLTEEGDTVTLTTGLFFEIPEGKALMIYSRSGQGFNHNTRLSNSVGVLDSDYRGELKVKLRMDRSERAMRISADTAIAQGIIIDVPKVEFITVQELSETERGTGGFGSTDKKVK